MNVALRMWETMGGLDRTILLVSVGLGLLYWLSTDFRPYPGAAVIKGLCCTLLAIVAFRVLGPKAGFLLGLALLFSAAGDVFLAIERPNFFTYGLVAFLIGHVLYIVLFARNVMPVADITVLRWTGAGCVIAFAVVMGVWLKPSLGGMTVPVLAYVAVITTMGVLSIVAGFPTWLVIVGALLFMASDSILAVNKFKTAVPASGYLIWATYYAAQALILLGVAGSKLRTP